MKDDRKDSLRKGLEEMSKHKTLKDENDNDIPVGSCFMLIPANRICPHCLGLQMIDGKVCPVCNGEGWVEEGV